MAYKTKDDAMQRWMEAANRLEKVSKEVPKDFIKSYALIKSVGIVKNLVKKGWDK